MTITVMNVNLNLFVAMAVFAATVVTDAVYVQFTAAVASRQRLRAANWSSIWYLLSALLGDQLYRQPGLCRVRRYRLVGRRLSVADLAQSRQNGRAPAAGRALRFARVCRR
jgi:hypothetical protein